MQRIEGLPHLKHVPPRGACAEEPTGLRTLRSSANLTSNIMLMVGRMAMISLLGRHSFLLSSSTAGWKRAQHVSAQPADEVT